MIDIQNFRALKLKMVITFANIDQDRTNESPKFAYTTEVTHEHMCSYAGEVLVNWKLQVGFVSTRPISSGEELMAQTVERGPSIGWMRHKQCG